MRIKITSERIGEVYATLTDENPITARKFFDVLPIEGKTNLWGDEIYFPIPLEIESENPRVVVKECELAIWIENPAFCIFFGKTPVSTETEIRAFSDVNVIGRIEGDQTIFKKTNQGEIIKIEKDRR